MNLTNKINPAHTALIVVDVQNDFCHENGSLAKQGADIGMVKGMVSPLQKVIQLAKAVGTTVIYIQTVHETSTDSATWISRFKNKQEQGVCRRGTWGADFFEVSPTEDDIVVTKHRYSAFIHTRLDSVLRTENIKTLVMTGVSTNVCVESTARDGFMLDYDIIMLSDCTAAYSKPAHEMSLTNIDEFFGSVADSVQIMDAWSSIEKVPSTI